MPESGLGALSHTLLALKPLPRSEREAWKRLFGHCVFDDHDPATHIPVERRNLLGLLPPPLVEQIKRKIRFYL